MIDLESCHKYGIFHEAVAIIIYNNKKEILFTLRSKNKLGGGKWEIPTTHIRGGFFINALECLKREVRIKGVELDYLGRFHYKVKLKDGIENELVHILISNYDGEINPNPEEVEDIKWIKLEEISESPDNAYWSNMGIIKLYQRVKDYFDKLN